LSGAARLPRGAPESLVNARGAGAAGLVGAAQRWLGDAPRQTTGVRALQIAIGTMLFLRVCNDAPFASFLWGPHGLGWGSTRTILGATLGGVVDHVYESDVSVYALLGCLAVGAVGLILGYRTSLATLAALVPYALLEQRLPQYVDRGDSAARLALLYLLFVLPSGARPAPGSLAVWLHNVAVVAIGLQAATIYAAAGLAKLAGSRWLDGTAIYHVAQVAALSHPAFVEVARQPLVTAFGSYATLVYELLFPLAIISPLRLPWIAVGLLFHVAIGGLMGLVTFSIVMIGLDLFFVTDREYAQLGRWAAGRWRAALGQRRPAGPGPP
jgi:hypothetical protein